MIPVSKLAQHIRFSNCVINLTYLIAARRVIVSAGESIIVPFRTYAVLDCGSLINSKTRSGENATITWYRNGIVIVNGFNADIVLSPDKQTVTIDREVPSGFPGLILERKAPVYSCDVHVTQTATNECCKYLLVTVFL